MTLPAIINYFQDCTTFHSEDIGYGYERLKREQKAWILSYWQIVVDRYPGMGERIKVCTWPTGFKGFLGDRNFKILDEKGESIAHAYSLWIYMDMKKGRPTRPPKEEIEAYGCDEPLDMEYEARKISVPDYCEEKEPVHVRKDQIDTNNHMNNCQYVQLALEMIEEEITVKQVRVEYKKSAMFQDVIIPKVAKEDDRIVVELCDPDGAIYAIVEFRGELS